MGIEKVAEMTDKKWLFLIFISSIFLLNNLIIKIISTSLISLFNSILNSLLISLLKKLCDFKIFFLFF
jgi:hypothetical protein